MHRGGALIALGLLLTGCGSQPHPAPPLPVAVTLHLEAPSAAFRLQGLSHRWVPADIYQYEVTLRSYDENGNPGPNPPVTVVLPQKGTVRSTARFTALRQGLRYQAEVLAWGNVGGTAPEVVLNGQAATRPEFDLTARQDVGDTHAWSGRVTLDSVPFSGSLRLEPQNVPAGADAFRVTLRNDETDAVLYAANYGTSETMTLINLRLGVPYRASVEAIEAGVVLATTATDRYMFDPAGQDLEQDHVSRPSF